MPPKKKKDNTIKVKKFKNSDTDWWCGGRHFKIQNNRLVMCAGGLPDEEITKKMKAYLKRNKIDFD